MEHITIEKLLKIKDAAIIDIRSEEKFNEFHMPKAINVFEIGALLNPTYFFQKDTTYYFICNSGNTSQAVCNELLQQGYNCVNVAGGTKAYIAYCQEKQ